MGSHREDVEDYIHNNLPEHFGSGTISDMYTDLEKDIRLIKTRSPTMSQKKMEMMLHQRHKRLAFSYPSLFFRIVRGEVDQEMLASLLTLKQRLDENEMSLADARNRVIDCAKNQIDSTRGQPRPSKKKDKAPGTVVQELSFKCKPEDS
ncbi:unnamed protein product [Ectocarpus sp. 12 AP-2014]